MQTMQMAQLTVLNLEWDKEAYPLNNNTEAQLVGQGPSAKRLSRSGELTLVCGSAENSFSPSLRKVTTALITLSVVLAIAVGLSVWALMDGLNRRGNEQLAIDLNRKTFGAFHSQVTYYGQSTAWAVQLASESLRLSAKELGRGATVLYDIEAVHVRRALLDAVKQFDTMYVSFPETGKVAGYLREPGALLKIFSGVDHNLMLSATDEFGYQVGPAFFVMANYDFTARPWWPGADSNGTKYSAVYPDAASTNAVMTTTCPIFFDLQPIEYVAGARNYPAGVVFDGPVDDPRMQVAVVASDINMRQFSSYLSRLEIGINDSGILFVLDKIGRMFACSNYSVIPVDNVMPHVTTISDPLVNVTMEFIMNRNQLDRDDPLSYDNLEPIEYSLVKIMGSWHVIGLQHVSINPQTEKWTGVIVFPAADYFSASQRASSVALGVSLGVIIPVLASLFGLIVYYRVSRPLTKISNLLNNVVSDLDFSKRYPFGDADRSSIREIDSMQKSYQHLISGLKSFSKYAPMDIVRDLVSNGVEAELLVESRVCTSYFSDIEGFSSIAEKLTPQDLIIILKEYFEAMIPPIKDNDGTLGDFIGDAIFAFWGAMRPDPHHALHCCRAAWIHQQRMMGLRTGWTESGYPAMRIRIGINTGLALAGNTGTDSRMKYTLIGDSVNLAARLEHINKYYGTYLICSEDTWMEPGVRDEFISRVLDIIIVKGRENPVTVREIIGRIGEGSAEQQWKLLEIQRLSEAWLEFYVIRSFLDCREVLQEICRLEGGSHVCTTLIQRVDKFIAEGVGPDWNGVNVMIHK